MSSRTRFLLTASDNPKLFAKSFFKSFNHDGSRPVRFPGIAGNAGNHGKDGKFHKSDQVHNHTKRNINKLFLGKVSLQKTLGIKFPVDSGL